MQPFNRRSEWLLSNSFSKDPFSPSAFWAENDPLLEKDMPAFVPTEVYKKILVELQDSSCKLVLGKTGSGKTALRKRLFADTNPKLTQSNAFFPIQYTDHSYSIYHADIDSHIDRILSIATRFFSDKDTFESQWDRFNSPSDRINLLVEYVQKMGYEKIILLIDNLDKDSPESVKIQYQKIESLLFRKDIFEDAGIGVRIFAPASFKELNNYDLKKEFIEILWNDKEDNSLSQVIDERLWACLDANISRVRSVPPLGFLCETNKINTVQDMMLSYGKKFNSLREIWRFGNFLLEENVVSATTDHLISSLEVVETANRKYQQFYIDEITQSRKRNATLSNWILSDNSTLFSLVEKNLSDYDISDALDNCAKIEPNSTPIMLLRMDFERIQKNFINGTITREDQETAENKLAVRIKEYLDVLRNRLI